MPGDSPITPVAPRPVLDWILVKAPFASVLAGQWVARRPAGTPARQRFVTWFLVRGFEAHTRMDVEFTLLGYEPDVEIELSGAEGLGLKAHYKGHEGWYELIGDLYENFERPRYSVTRLIDAGDRLVFEFEVVLTGRASSVETALVVGTVAHLSDSGRVGRQQLFWQGGIERAVEAAGLRDVG